MAPHGPMNEFTNSGGRDPAVEGGRPSTAAPEAVEFNQSLGIPVRDRTSRRRSLWLVLAVGCVAAFVDVVVAGRSGLWMDEIFSLAMATGHSLDYPAYTTDRKPGDFVEPAHPVPAGEVRRYLEHDYPLCGPGRVIRAVSLSGGAPPLYYLLLYGWTMALGTSDIVLRLFSITCFLACLPFLASIARRIGGSRAVFPSCALFAFSPLTIYFATEGRMYSLLLLCVLAVMWASLRLHEHGGSLTLGAVWIVSSAAGFLTHYFFVFPWVATVAYLLLTQGKFSRLNLAVSVFLIVALIPFWYVKVPLGVANWRAVYDVLKLVPPGFDRTMAILETPVRFFSGRSQLWRGDPRDPFNPLSLVLFGVIAAIAVWRLRLRVFGGPRLMLWFVFGAACLGPLVCDSYPAHLYDRLSSLFDCRPSKRVLVGGFGTRIIGTPDHVYRSRTYTSDVVARYLQHLP